MEPIERGQIERGSMKRGRVIIAPGGAVLKDNSPLEDLLHDPQGHFTPSTFHPLDILPLGDVSPHNCDVNFMLSS